MNYEPAKIRCFLQERFSDEELNHLCFDYFPTVQNDFTMGMRKAQKVQMLMEHCQKQGRWPALVAALERERPQPYAEQFATTPEVEPIPQPRVPGQRNPRQIFISYANQDSEFAQQLATDLKKRDWPVWIAPDSIHPGEKWVEAINRGMEESSVFLLVLTPNAVKSRWVKSETNIAIQWEHQDKLRFIPLRMQPEVVPNTPAFWQSYQQIPFDQTYQIGLKTLLNELQPKPIKPSPPQISTSWASWVGGVPVWSWVVLAVAIVGFSIWSIRQLAGDDSGKTTPAEEIKPGGEETLSLIQTRTPKPDPAPTKTALPSPTGPQPTSTPTFPQSPSATPIFTFAPTLIPTQTLPPVPTPSENLVCGILFTDTQNQNGDSVADIFLVNSDGSELVNLTKSEWNEGSPTISPDGQQIAFDTDRDDNSEIYVLDLNSMKTTNLTQNSGYDIEPVWSPNGDRIAFISYRDNDGDIFVMDKDGSRQFNLTNSYQWESQPIWSPNSSKIAFLSDKGLERGVWVMDADGVNQFPITEEDTRDTGTSSNYTFTWAPDSIRLAVTMNIDGKNDIYVVEINESGRTGLYRLTNDSTTERNLAWSPNSEWIAFSKEVGGKTDIYLIHAVTKDVIQLTFDEDSEWAFKWSPDGRYLAFAKNLSIFTIELEGNKFTRLTHSIEYLYQRTFLWNPSCQNFP